MSEHPAGVRPALDAKAFDALLVPGLEARMAAIERDIRPIFRAFAEAVAPMLAAGAGEPMHVHIAKHARRTVNPPNDTWVAFSSDPRGYKKRLHFQFGLWPTHAFFWLAAIYESPFKPAWARRWLEALDDVVRLVPGDFVWSFDHTAPDVVRHDALGAEGLEQAFRRAMTVKKAELLVGRILPREKAEGADLVAFAEATARPLFRLYRIALSIDAPRSG
ncbi:DUF1054 domain-containing protein [Hydrogenibacillus sp. N12]|uniref:DUF1054 domain-containing protein n=1 Tax=Hydrogenibacillus sp. N12 TaxID=2866627 RepID=UPI001C7E0CF3|nr:DUF1054 domain-containing protein [Hydrogenibacillus sp. N12]QZA33425.1 DUF1054 domain-containing protein [Hydrogenibacillus sp. N12]